MTRERITLNAIFLFGGALLGSIFSFLFQIIVAQTFGSEAYGTFVLSTSIVSMAAVLATIGFSEALVKFIGEYNMNNTKLSGIIRLGFGAPLLASIFIFAILYVIGGRFTGYLFNSRTLNQLFTIILASLPAIVLVRLSAATLLGFERGDLHVFIGDVLRAGILIVLTAGGIYLGYPFLDIGRVYVVSYWISAIVGVVLVVWVARQVIQSPPDFSFKKMLYFSFPLLLSSQAGIISNWIDTILVGVFLGTSKTGIYQSGFVLATSVLLFMGPISGSLYPNFSRLVGKKNRTDIEDQYRDAAKWGVMFTMAPTLYLMFFPHISLSTIFGNEFTAAWAVVIIIVISKLLSVAVGPGTEIVKALGDSRYVFITVAVALLVNIIVNLLLIPLIGIAGAAIGTALAALIKNGMHFRRVRANFAISLPYLDFGRSLFAAAVGGVIGSQFLNFVNGFPTFIAHILLYSAIYLIALFIVDGYKISDIKYVWGVIRGI